MTGYAGLLILTGLLVGFLIFAGWLIGKNAEQAKREQMTAFALKEEKEMKEHEAKLHSGPRRTLSAITQRLRDARSD